MCILLGFRASAQPPSISSSQFAARALPALPFEESHEFPKILAGELDRFRRDASAQPAADEMTIPNQGWSLILRSDAGPVVRTAAEEFRTYLEKAMRIRVSLEEKPSLADWAGLSQAIVAGTGEQMPGCGSDLKGRKDYQIRVAPERVAVCGFDERGAMYGLYNLEARMNLREAPFLPRNVNITRHSLFKARMTLSGLGWMEWPDWYLRLLPRYGFDSIYASVYANPNGVPAEPPYDFIRRQDPERVRDLIRRAARYGIELYCPIMFHLTGDADNEARLRKLVRDIITTFPEIRGYVLLIEGFIYDGWPGWNRTPEDIRDWVKHWARGVAVATEEAHKINPAIEMLPWDYNVDFRPQAAELKKFVIDQYPLDTIPLITWSNGKGFERDGERGYLKDYAINEIGPSEVADAQIRRARERGARAVYVKADTWASWQFGTFPYLPFPYQWFERYKALEKYQVDGVMESWSYGFKPNFVAELRAWNSWSNAPPLDYLLRAVGRRDFGARSEARVLEAWDHFSRAIRLVPDTGPNMGTTNAIGTPLFFEKPAPRAMTVEHSWEDQERWMRKSEINPYWPYAPRRVILFPDFTNRVNAAERYAQPFSVRVFNKYLLLAADEMERGLESYRAAALAAPERKIYGALREVLLAEQLQRMMRSDAAILEFENLRFGLDKIAEPAEHGRVLDRMTAIVKQEIERTMASLETSRRDSRLGYEWEQDYFYTPYVLEEKLKLLRLTLEQQIPAYRRRHNL
ncbi:MAG: hypothetical protein HY235_09305 [Acidobacteria bacterium]|nr:hypothetical protein [Acidobacteriota bacterium]